MKPASSLFSQVFSSEKFLVYRAAKMDSSWVSNQFLGLQNCNEFCHLDWYFDTTPPSFFIVKYDVIRVKIMGGGIKIPVLVTIRIPIGLVVNFSNRYLLPIRIPGIPASVPLNLVAHLSSTINYIYRRRPLF